MSTLTTVRHADRPRRAAEPRARFRDLVAAEWIKLRSLRSTYWVLALSALVVIAFNVNAACDHTATGRRRTAAVTGPIFVADGIPLCTRSPRTPP